MLYYIVVTLISVAIVVLSYFDSQALSIFWREMNQWFSNTWMDLLRITLLVKPIFMILMPYSELKLITFRWLRDYLKTVKGRGVKGLRKMLLSIICFVAGLGMKRRRQLGVTTFLLIFVHAGMYIIGRMKWGVSILSQLQQHRLLAGYIWIVALFIGRLTSNNFSIRLFKGRRKPIQYTAYLALVAAIIHLVLISREYAGQLVMLVIYTALKLIEKKKIRIF